MDRGRRTTGMIDPAPSQRVLGDSIQGQDAAGHPVLTLRWQRPGVPKKRSVSVGGASLSSEDSNGWSPEKGCSLKNKKEGGEGLSRPLRAYPISSCLPGLLHPPGLRFIACILPELTRGGQGHRGSSPQNYNTQHPWTVRGGSLVGVGPKN